MKTLKEVLSNINGGNVGFMGVRLFSDNTNKLLPNSDKILASDQLDKFEVVTMSVNELFMTYDIRVKLIKEDQ